MSKLPFLIGTYTKSGSHGIYKSVFDSYDGSFQSPSLYYEIEEPKFIIQNDDYLISTIKNREKAGIALIDTQQPLIHMIDSVYHETSTACHIACQNSTVVSANYHEGIILIYEIKNRKLHLKHKIKLGKDAKCHQVFFHKNYLFITCLGLNKIIIFDEHLDYDEIESIPLPKKCGPRNAIFDPSNSHLYVLTEISNEIYAFKKTRNIHFQGIQINTVLPQNGKKENASAAICMHPDGQHLYTTTRGSNIITVFEIEKGYLKPIQFVECGGDHPREMKLDPTHRFLIVANRHSNTVISFRLDLSGLICEQCDEIYIHEPSCIQFI